MSKPNNDYEGCLTTGVPIPRELHQDLKVYCVKNNVSMKEVLYNLNLKSIKELLGDD